MIHLLKIRIKLKFLKLLLKLKIKRKFYDNNFDSLNTRYPVNGSYGYSKYDKWLRAIERTRTILQKVPHAKEKSMYILEIGSGDGNLGKILSEYGHQVYLYDIKDWRDDETKFLKFYQNFEDLLTENIKFDIVVSFNTLEHIQNLDKLMKDLKKCIHNDTILYFEYGPLYYSAYGKHTHNIFGIPYAHLIFTSEFLEKKINEFGVKDLGGNVKTLQFVNGLKQKEYLQIFKDNDFKVTDIYYHREYYFLKFLIKHFRSFKDLDIDVDDLLIKSVFVTLKQSYDNPTCIRHYAGL